MDVTPLDADRAAAAASGVTSIILEGRALGVALAALAGICVLAFVMGMLAARGMRAPDASSPSDAPLIPADASWVRMVGAVSSSGSTPSAVASQRGADAPPARYRLSAASELAVRPAGSASQSVGGSS